MGKNKRRPAQQIPAPPSAAKELAIAPDPPPWLIEVCGTHQPMLRGADLVCQAPECSDLHSATPWTSDHIARKVHEGMAQGILALLRNKGVQQ